MGCLNLANSRRKTGVVVSASVFLGRSLERSRICPAHLKIFRQFFSGPNLTPEQVRTIEAGNEAIRTYHATGDPRPAIEAGLFPERDDDFSSDDYRD